MLLADGRDHGVTLALTLAASNIRLRSIRASRWQPMGEWRRHLSTVAVAVADRIHLGPSRWCERWRRRRRFWADYEIAAAIAGRVAGGNSLRWGRGDLCH